MSEAERKQAYADLDAAVQRVAGLRDDDDDINEFPETVTDWVVITGSQFFDDDGDRAGVVSVLPRHRSQPAFITAGLLQQALSHYSGNTGS